ncbi:MAG TPA: trypsin-like peptidase domain-containing protein [Acidimicrobiales bacterium]|nr:trypsin-like peptidase domain-containing protein [Acidimicrobiales bacterium]
MVAVVLTAVVAVTALWLGRPTNTVPGGLAAKVDPGIVDVVSTLGLQGAEAAGTGMVLTSSGEVLTNNHVIYGATAVKATDVGNGRTYKATVVGTDRSDDVALLQLQGASHLRTVAVGRSSSVAVGDAVIAFGNAGGVGGTPSAVRGVVTALGREIIAQDSMGLSEELSGLIETDTAIEAGDSGGPLVNLSGEVVGVNTAASNGYSFATGTNQAFHIPITTAVTVANQIAAGKASATVHIGPSAFLGVSVMNLFGAGALVVGVEPGSPAAQAGLVSGDVITLVNGSVVGSASALTDAIDAHHPGDVVQLSWIDQAGNQQTATVHLVTGPAD